MTTYLRPAVVMLVTMTVVTGVIYPALVTIGAKGLFPVQAEGSLLTTADGRVVGSELIGQSFTDDKHFFGRPSATTPQPNNGLGSGGSNLGPTNPALIDAVRSRAAAVKDNGNTDAVPIDLVTASASGLDPEISLAAALYQVPRVAKARGVDTAQLQVLVEKHTKGPQLGFLGPARVNVVELNLDLDHK
jgi:potassium-transporting ATPase KdpC subunit